MPLDDENEIEYSLRRGLVRTITFVGGGFDINLVTSVAAGRG